MGTWTGLERGIGIALQSLGGGATPDDDAARAGATDDPLGAKPKPGQDELSRVRVVTLRRAHLPAAVQAHEQLLTVVDVTRKALARAPKHRVRHRLAPLAPDEAFLTGRRVFEVRGDPGAVNLGRHRPPLGGLRKGAVPVP